MKFRIKMMFGMLCLLALLFSIGGSTLIALSFESSLAREKDSARESYQMILETMAVVSSMNVWTKSADVSNMLDQLYSQGMTWSALRLSTDEGFIHEIGGSIQQLAGDHEDIDPGYCEITTLVDDSGTQYLHLSGAFMVNDEKFYFDALQDISPLYQARDQQRDVYQVVFVILIALCAVLAYGTSWFLTRPLSKLSRASREIASGNLSSRSKIRSNDEMGKVGEDFDLMAHEVEKSVTTMQESVEQQERFMGSFAHELKTPMTAIIGYADLMRKGKLDTKEQIDAAQYIFSEGVRLESLSLKLLDIFVLDKSDIELKLESPSILIKDIATHLTPSLKENDITLQTKCEKGYCYLEPDLVRSLLLNLIDNARKASEKGSTIKIVSTMIPEGCSIQVIDEGKGIPDQFLEHLGEAFYRVDVSRSRSEGGAGLGLTLCAKIADLHQGTLTVKSQVGVGTCMTVELRSGSV